jgi:hypothetical protein
VIDETTYRCISPPKDLGAEHFQRRPSTTQIKRLVQKLSSFGYDVIVKPLADGAKTPSVSF